jgi:dihydroflavonol-4-reductase
MLLEGLPLQFIAGDLTSPETLPPALKGVEVVFHCAALTSPRLTSHGRMYAITVEGTRSLLQACIKAGVRRVIHTSSAAALGIPLDRPFTRPPFHILMDENHSWNIRPDIFPSGYAKHLAEREVQHAVARGLDAVILNPTMVLGAGDFHRQSCSIVVQAANQRLPFLVKGGINVVHIRDVVAGYLAALGHGKTGERYILGGENLPYARLVEYICQAAGTSPPQLTLPNIFARGLSAPARALQSFLHMPVEANLLNLAGYYFYYAIRKSQQQLGLPPPLPAEEAVGDAFEWFRKAGVILPLSK